MPVNLDTRAAELAQLQEAHQRLQQTVGEPRHEDLNPPEDPPQLQTPELIQAAIGASSALEAHAALYKAQLLQDEMSGSLAQARASHAVGGLDAETKAAKEAEDLFVLTQ